MQPTKYAVHYKTLFVLFGIIETSFILLCEWQGKNNYKEGLAFSLLFLFLFALFDLIIAKNEARIFKYNNKIIYLYVGILISSILVLLSRFFPLYHLWMIGCIVTAIVYSINLGIIELILFLCLDGICQAYQPEQFVFYGVLGVVICLLISFFPKEKKLIKLIQTYFYYIIIVLSSHVTLFLLTNTFDYTKLCKINFLYELTCSAIIITILFVTTLYIKRDTE